MFKKNHFFLIFFVGLLSQGCSTIYRANDAEIKDFTTAKWREYFRTGAVIGFLRDLGCGSTYQNSITVIKDKVHASCKHPTVTGTEKVYSFAEYPDITSTINGNHACIKIGNDSQCSFAFDGPEGAIWGRHFVRAWYAVARAPILDLTDYVVYKVELEKYLNAKVKPTLPEEAIKYKIQAEHAIKEKRFQDAVALFNKGLEISPWWPAGRYNRALILAELQEYGPAIAELKRYLQLEPNAPNARAVQNKIYEFEGMLK